MPLQLAGDNTSPCKHYASCCNCIPCQKRAALFRKLRKQGVPESEAAIMAAAGATLAPHRPRQPWEPRKAA